jgi:hypothetical protein
MAWQSSGQDSSGYGIFGRRLTPPQVVAYDDLVLEGNSGTTNAVFWVGLSEPPELGGPVTVAHATADATASTGSDYTSTMGSTVFPVGNSGPALVTVPVSGDTLYEADEVFLLDFTVTGGWASTALGPALGAIFNDDPPPSLSIGDVQLTEGNSGTTTAQFTVSISTVSGLPARVDFNTFDGTATAGEDYTAATGSLVFPAMSTGSQIASVLVTGDLLFERDETFFMQLVNSVEATIADGQGLGTILNDDGNYLITTGPGSGGASRTRRYSGQ